MIDCSALIASMDGSPLAAWAEQLPTQLEARFSQRLHGEFDKWMEIIDSLPVIPADSIELDRDSIRVSSNTPLPSETLHLLEQELKQLHPWRKGPYEIHGVKIDTEWRSDWKWQRLQGAINSLEGRRVLDVGCGNGYH